MFINLCLLFFSCYVQDVLAARGGKTLMQTPPILGRPTQTGVTLALEAGSVDIQFRLSLCEEEDNLDSLIINSCKDEDQRLYVAIISPADDEEEEEEHASNEVEGYPQVGRVAQATTLLAEQTTEIEIKNLEAGTAYRWRILASTQDTQSTLK